MCGKLALEGLDGASGECGLERCAHGAFRVSLAREDSVGETIELQFVAASQRDLRELRTNPLSWAR